MQKIVHRQYQFQPWFQLLQLAVIHMPENDEQPVHIVSVTKRKKCQLQYLQRTKCKKETERERGFIFSGINQANAKENGLGVQ